MSLRVLSYNIRHGGHGREQLIAGVIKSVRPDVVILQEAVRPDVVRHLAEDCGMPWWTSVRGNSLAFLSRVEVKRHEYHEVRFARRSYLEVQLAQPGMRIFGVHLSAIHSNVTELRRAYELRSLLAHIRQRHHGEFHVVTGDFNTLAPGEELDLAKLPFRLRAFVWLTGKKIRFVTIRMMLEAGYIDGYRSLHKGPEGYTFPVWDPHLRLDFLFLPSEAVSRLKSCEVIREAPRVRDASDHLPLLSEIAEG